MPSEIRVLSAWALYASSLVLASLAIHRWASPGTSPPPPPGPVPVLEVAADGGDLDRDGRIGVSFRVYPPVPGGIKVAYTLTPPGGRRRA